MNKFLVFIGACLGMAMLSLVSAVPPGYIAIAQEILTWWYTVIMIVFVALLGAHTLFGGSINPVLYLCGWVFGAEFLLGLYLNLGPAIDRTMLGQIFAGTVVVVPLVIALYWGRNGRLAAPSEVLAHQPKD